MGLLMVLESLRQDGAAAVFLGEGKSLSEASDFIKRFRPDVVCVSCTLNECVPAAAELVSLVRRDSPSQEVRRLGRHGSNSWRPDVPVCSIPAAQRAAPSEIYRPRQVLPANTNTLFSDPAKLPKGVRKGLRDVELDTEVRRLICDDPDHLFRSSAFPHLLVQIRDSFDIEKRSDINFMEAVQPAGPRPALRLPSADCRK